MPKSDNGEIQAKFPSASHVSEDWQEFFATPAGEYALGRILYDIYDKVMDTEEKEAGLRRMGRRPAREAVPLPEVYRRVLPRPASHVPFGDALKVLLEGRSLRSFALRVPMAVSTLSRMMRGELTPDLAMLEAIAAAAKVHPSYFMEWRAMYVSQMISEVFMENPALSIAAYKALRTGQRSLREGKS